MSWRTLSTWPNTFTRPWLSAAIARRRASTQASSRPVTTTAWSGSSVSMTFRVASSRRPKPPPDPSMKRSTGRRGDRPRANRAAARSAGSANSAATGTPVTVTRSRGTPRGGEVVGDLLRGHAVVVHVREDPLRVGHEVREHGRVRGHGHAPRPEGGEGGHRRGMDRHHVIGPEALDEAPQLAHAQAVDAHQQRRRHADLVAEPVRAAPEHGSPAEHRVVERAARPVEGRVDEIAEVVDHGGVRARLLRAPSRASAPRGCGRSRRRR